MPIAKLFGIKSHDMYKKMHILKFFYFDIYFLIYF
jgi:hypothetical protein